jgi:hypothetical protein
MLIVAITLERVSHYYHIIVVVLLLYGREHHIIITGRLKWLPRLIPAFICSTQRVKIATFCINTDLIVRRFVCTVHNMRQARYDNDDPV